MDGDCLIQRIGEGRKPLARAVPRIAAGKDLHADANQPKSAADAFDLLVATRMKISAYPSGLDKTRALIVANI
jgi:hypothetical protein